MAETYYIRLPFYLINGSTPKTVNISFDNDVVSTAEITSTDSTNKNNVTLSVNKDPGTYEIKIAPEFISGENTTVCLDDIWVSLDNVNFYSFLLSSQDKVDNLPNEEFGFDPAKGACLWADYEFIVNLPLPDAANWNNVYNAATLADLQRGIDYLVAKGDNPTLLAKAQEAYALFNARGYN